MMKRIGRNHQAYAVDYTSNTTDELESYGHPSSARKRIRREAILKQHIQNLTSQNNESKQNGKEVTRLENDLRASAHLDNDETEDSGHQAKENQKQILA